VCQLCPVYVWIEDERIYNGHMCVSVNHVLSVCESIMSCLCVDRSMTMCMDGMVFRLYDMILSSAMASNSIYISFVFVNLIPKVACLTTCSFLGNVFISS